MQDTKEVMKQFKRTLSLMLALVMLMSMVYFAPSAKAAASTYISTTYPANLSVKTTSAINLMTEPIISSTAKYTLPVDTTLTVKALHKSTAGTYWYEVLYYDTTLYVDATATTLLDHLTGDVTIADAVSPASLSYGEGFPVSGDISSTLNDLGTITAAMYSGSDLTKFPVMTSSDKANSKSYSLSGSTIDANLLFGDMDPGVYTYAVTAEAVSYYIDDNDALATSVLDVVVEDQHCVITDWENPNDALAFGIDISVWNGTIDWADVKADGVEFAILRIGYEETMDSTFLYNARGCMENDIPFGVYLYSYAESASEAVGEAEFVLNSFKNYSLKCDLPIWFDMEDSVHAALSTSQKHAIVKAFCKTIQEAGYQPGLYTSVSWFRSYFTDSYFDSLPKWIAQIDGYSSNGTSTFDGGTWMWQYSWTGSIDGIPADVDCNYYYAEIPGYVSSDTSYLSQCTYYPSHLTAVTTSSVTMRQYPGSAYNSLKTVSANTSLEVTGVYKNTSGEYWYQVLSGNTTGYIDADYMTVSEFFYDDVAVIDPAMASNISLGSSYSLSGNIVSKYNNISTAYAKIYAGEDTLASPVLSSSDSPNGKHYRLSGSAVDQALAFNDLDSDYYTYEISADVKNYYVNSGSLTAKTENVVLWTAPFTVGSAPIEPPAEVSCDHNIVTDAAVAPTCTATGLTEGSHCTKCNVVFTPQTVIPATGHSYGVTSDKATCQDYELFHYLCSKCGHSYDVAADELAQWSDSKPLGVDDSLIETKTQYRYADCTSTSWKADGSGSVQYVNSWPSGFDTSHSLYSQYNKKSSKVTSTETATSKIGIDSDTVTGYIWYHWCGGGSYSTESETSSYGNFHAFYSTDVPGEDTNGYDASDGSYKLSSSTACSSCLWYWPLEVYTQSYTTYTAVPDGQSWGSWSAWSDTVYTAVENTRKVETRTVYRYTGAELGDHAWNNGVCTVCGTECTHSYTNDVCTICGVGAHITDYYLFGNINGVNVGCEEDYENVGDYLFVDGKFTMTFTENSYVAVKSADNERWFMTDGFLGQDVTSATLYNSVLIGNAANKLFVPKGYAITFTLVTNDDGTLTLSYEIGTCSHVWVDGTCSNCGETCAHRWINGACGTCGMAMTIPTLKPKSASVSFECEIRCNIYFTVEDLGEVSLSEMGLITWNTPQSEGTILDATCVIPGVSTDGTTYMAHSEGIAANRMADTLYFKIYAKLPDGTYTYTDLYSFNVKNYAQGRINNSSNEYMRALCVALLDYGSAAQTYFSYKAYSLMNSGLTAEQSALVSDYSSSMISPLTTGLSSKFARLTYDGSSFSQRFASVSFDGALSLNYYFTPAHEVDSNMTFYYWDMATYNSVSQLTTSNATGHMTMTPTDNEGQYWGTVPDIAASQINDTYFVAGVYVSDGVTYNTGILRYSVAKYCQNIAANDNSAQQEFAQATAVYGYYAKAYFDSLTT